MVKLISLNVKIFKFILPPTQECEQLSTDCKHINLQREGDKNATFSQGFTKNFKTEENKTLRRPVFSRKSTVAKDHKSYMVFVMDDDRKRYSFET